MADSTQLQDLTELVKLCQVLKCGRLWQISSFVADCGRFQSVADYGRFTSLWHIVASLLGSPEAH